MGSVSMSMRPSGPGGVPAETARGAQAAFPKGSPAIRIRDELGPLFSDEEFTDLFPSRGKPAWSPGRSALVPVLQFMEGLTDRQAAEAVRARINFKYALGLDLADPGFDFSVLSEFRDRLATPAGERPEPLAARLPRSTTSDAPRGLGHGHPRVRPDRCSRRRSAPPGARRREDRGPVPAVENADSGHTRRRATCGGNRWR
ncbi:hypothetical protein GCM10010207_58300 [Streptomyces atratus]|nr:hypothetical protein GCM10010207_58300 [Streptomyces atratus]